MNGYIQVKISGNTVGLKFAFPAIRWFAEASISKGDLYLAGDAGFTTEGFAKLMECSYKNNCLIKEVEPELKYEDFYNFVEQAQETEEGQKELGRIAECYADSSAMKKVIEEQKKSQVSQ